MAEQVEEAEPVIRLARMKTEPIERPSSPETNCAICLEEFNNKSYTDSCLHEFCFLCLKEWSKIKPECPLCKQRFNTIIHNVRSHQDYDEYHVNNNSANPIDQAHQVLLNFALQRTAIHFNSSPPNYRNSLTYQTIVEDSMYRHQHGPRPHIFYREPHSIISVPEPGYFHDLSSAPVGRTRNRREVYRNNRWVRPTTSGRVRESSPEFYRLNVAQTHRLVPWLTRELNVLLDIDSDSSAYCQEIIRLITIYPIRSRQFREAMRPALGERVDHFIHEFYHFAISPYDMIYHDIVSEYDVPAVRPSRFARGEPSDSDSDIEVVHELPLPKPPVCVGASGLLDLTNRAGPSSESRAPPPVIVISDSTSSDDDVEIISYSAPTPELIIIDDSTESEPEIEVLTFDPNSSSNCTAAVNNDSENSNRSDCCHSMHNMLHNIEAELIDDRNPSSFENASRSPSPPMPYLRAIGSNEPCSPSSSETSASTSMSISLPLMPLPTPSPSSSSSTFTSSSSDSNYCPYERKRSVRRRKRKKPASTKGEKLKKRPRKSSFKVEDTSSDEEPEPRTSRPRLRSVVVKPEPSSNRRSNWSDGIFPTDSN